MYTTFGGCALRRTLPNLSLGVNRMDQHDMAISHRVDELLRTSDDPREALVELVREHGPERTAAVARIVFGSGRTRIDAVEEVLKHVLAEHDASD